MGAPGLPSFHLRDGLKVGIAAMRPDSDSGTGRLSLMGYAGQGLDKIACSMGYRSTSISKRRTEDLLRCITSLEAGAAGRVRKACNGLRSSRSLENKVFSDRQKGSYSHLTGMLLRCLLK